LDRLRAALEGLNPRERIAVGVAGGVLGLVLVWFGLIAPTLDWVDSVHLRAKNAEQELLLMQRLRREYDEVNGRLGSVEERIRRGPKGNIFTTLEALAAQSAVKVDSMEPQVAPPSDRYQETKVQVVLKEVTLAQLVSYLHKVESAPQLLSVKSLRVRTRSDKPELLDVTFSVSSFEAI
jgi:type II secretory pathway component PulM